MPTARKINGFTILAVIPEAKTFFRTIGEEPEDGFFYVIIGDDPSTDRSVVAVVRNPQTDEQWIQGDYFHDTDPIKRRTQALLVAIERSRLRQVIGEAFVIQNLAKVWGFDANEVLGQ